MSRTKKTATFKYTLPVTPCPASRPRVTRRGHVYYGKKYTEFRNTSAVVLGEEKYPDTLPLSGPLHLDVTFYCTRPKKTNRLSPRGDIDNYLKTLDVLNRIIWYDDDQIFSLVARKEYSDEPRIELEVTEYGKLPKA